MGRFTSIRPGIQAWQRVAAAMCLRELSRAYWHSFLPAPWMRSAQRCISMAWLATSRSRGEKSPLYLLLIFWGAFQTHSARLLEEQDLWYGCREDLAKDDARIPDGVSRRDH